MLSRDVLSQKGRLLLLITCLVLSGTLFGLTASAVLYLQGEVRPRLRKLFPERRVVVLPQSSELMFLRIEGQKIGEETVEQIRGLDGVERVYPQLSASFPVSAEFNMQSVGAGFQTDIILFGIDREMVAESINPAAEQLGPVNGEAPVPVLISDYFLDAYNLGLAESSGMPKLSRSAVLGIDFELILGESTVGIGEVQSSTEFLPARVVGMTPNPLLFGVTAPIEKVREWNLRYTPGKDLSYAAVHLDVTEPEAIPELREKIEAMKLRFEAQADILDRYLRLVATIQGLLLGAFVLVASIAAIGVTTTMAAAIRDQRPRWGLYRATGFSPMSVLRLAMGHAIAAALPAALVASGLCLGIAAILSALFHDALENLSIFPGDPFSLGVTVHLAIFAFCLLFAIVPAIVFTLPICRARPMRLLSERSL